MNTERFMGWLTEAIDMLNEEDGKIKTVTTFEEAGLLTCNKGLVVKTTGGREFQITIMQSR